MPVLASWDRKYRKDGLVIVGITELRPTVAEVKKTAKERGVAYPLVIDTGEKIIKRYGFDAHPDTVVIDRSGKIVHVEIGFVKGDEKAIEQAMRPLLSTEKVRRK
jgi:peroxiredoxin